MVAKQPGTIVCVKVAQGQSQCGAKVSGFTAKAIVVELLRVIAVKYEDVSVKYLYDINFPHNVLYLCVSHTSKYNPQSSWEMETGNQLTSCCRFP